jgi:lipopolysaccharide assembly outer membrane protein LptD (OstA)
MLYNYKSKKGKIIDVTTKQDEGFLIGDVVKKDSMDNIYMRKGKYTTCDQDDPHFYFALNKVKVVKNDKIITLRQKTTDICILLTLKLIHFYRIGKKIISYNS